MTRDPIAAAAAETKIKIALARKRAATPENIAVQEMTRLKHAHAWSPIHQVFKRRHNQHMTRYTFADGSELTVYMNGDASWYFRDAKGNTAGEQRWPMWHHCNRKGR